MLKSLFLSGTILLFVFSSCSEKNSILSPIPPVPDPPKPSHEVQSWMTRSDQTALLQKQSSIVSFVSAANTEAEITIDSTVHFQSIDGFGYTLTGGSATLINRMIPTAKQALLKELFGKDSNSIGISYLRVSIGASDLSASVFTYNDSPDMQEDLALTRFNLSADTVDLIPVLKLILAINPSIKIMGTPWTAPSWMKSNFNSKGGTLLKKYQPVYAQYIVKYIQAMQAHGIPIEAITIQNEPQNTHNNPSMEMSSSQQADFIKIDLGPAFMAQGIKTKIIIWDHNCDQPSYPLDVLNDAEAKKYIDGTAFHLYGGDIRALSSIHSAHPDRALYFTEQWTGAKGEFGGDLRWHLRHVIIGSMNNWSKIALEWNLANDPQFGPHTPGGCTECKGALTIDGSVVTRNVAYYIIAHICKFVPPGSKRIKSIQLPSISNVAFLTPDGKKVLVALNDTNAKVDFNIGFNGKKALTSLPAGAVGTYVW